MGLIVSYALHLLILASCYTVNKKRRTVNIMKVYIERNTIHVELTRLRKTGMFRWHQARRMFRDMTISLIRYYSLRMTVYNYY